MSKLYELPEGWGTKKFDDIKISNVIGLVRNAKEQGQYLEYQYVKMNNITNDNLLTFDNIIYVDANNNEVEKFKLQKGDFLFNTRNSFELVGKSCIVDFESSKPILFNNNIMRVRFKNIVSPYFIAYQFRAYFIQNQLESIKSATTSVAAIYYKALREIDIIIPPLQEQKRIVDKLDSLFAKIDQAIALHQQNIDEAEGFMGSVLNEVFGELEGKYEKRTLFSFQPKISAGGTPLRKESSYWNGDIEWYSSGELNQLYTLPAKEKITQVGLDNSSAKLFPKGTLLMGMYDTAAMKMSILSNDGSCNQAIVGFKPQENELNIFFAKYQLEYLKEKILEQRQGVRQQNLNLSKIKNIELEYPPLKTQQQTVTYLDQLSQKTETLKQVQKEKLESLKALKASILDQAFRGEI